MPEMVLNALVQTPFVLAIMFITLRFLTYVDARDDEWRAFLQQRDAEWNKFLTRRDVEWRAARERDEARMAGHLQALNDTMREMHRLLINHDALVRARLESAVNPNHDPR